MSAYQFTPRIKDAAAALTRIIEDPAYAGQRWTWENVGAVLSLSIKDAKLVIYYLRETAANVTWTVGTHGSDWTFKPSTGLDKETLLGLINQYKHMLTRVESAAHAWSVLSAVDPEPAEARFAREQTKLFTRMGVDIRDAIDSMTTYLSGGTL